MLNKKEWGVEKENMKKDERLPFKKDGSSINAFGVLLARF
jgi:hypothetical protein